MRTKFDIKKKMKPYVVKLENHKQAQHWAKVVENWQSVSDLGDYPQFAKIESLGSWKGDLCIGNMDNRKKLISYEQGCRLLDIASI